MPAPRWTPGVLVPGTQLHLRDPVVRRVLEAAGLNLLPVYPGDLLQGSPMPLVPTVDAADITRAAEPKYCEHAREIAETYSIPIYDVALRGLALQWPKELRQHEHDASEIAPSFQPEVRAARRKLRHKWQHLRLAGTSRHYGTEARRLALLQCEHPTHPAWNHSVARLLDVHVVLFDVIGARIEWLCRQLASEPGRSAADQKHEAEDWKGRTADGVAAYLAAHHPIGRRIWRHVAWVLEFYGWDLGKKHLQFKRKDLEQAARRYRQRHHLVEPQPLRANAPRPGRP